MDDHFPNVHAQNERVEWMSETVVNLSNCDLEPIHIPGSIQVHGCLLACDDSCTKVLRRSENTDLFSLGVGANLSEVLGDSVAHDVRNALTSASDPTRAALIFNQMLPGGVLVDISAHRYRGSCIIELEPSNERVGPALNIMRAMVSRLRASNSVDQLLASTVRLFRGLLRYDRVMVYKFSPDGSGEVVAEARRPDLESFMGQHFPATDIPKQARRLYLQNVIRVIGDSSGKSSRVTPQLDESGQPLDLSFAHLRSVSPIHCEYLRNMGVGASMSVSIIVDGELWGLIACHHYHAKELPLALRIAAEMFGEFFSLHLSALTHEARLMTARETRSSLDEILTEATRHEDLFAFLTREIAMIGELIPCDGVAIYMDERYATHGYTPPEEGLNSIVKFLTVGRVNELFATSSLSERISTAIDYVSEASGLLAIPLSQTSNDYLMFFRREVVQTIQWAGDPNKTYSTGVFGDRLTPRKSFAIWKEIVRNRSMEWTDADREIAGTVRSYFIEILLHHRELIDDEREKATARQRVLSEELNHRVKNILALIKSLVSQSTSDDQTLEQYTSALIGRINALSVAHDQVVRGDGGGLLSGLLNAELSPYRAPGNTIRLEGPALHLDARAYSVLALVFHELATNAAKYGSLSRSGGRLDVTWSVIDGGDCELTWVEKGGPAVMARRRVGFGSTLIERSIRHDLGGTSTIAFASSGVRASILIPAKNIHASDAVQGDGEKNSDKPSSPRLTARSALILEDQFMIALDAEAVLESAGVREIELCSRVSDALDLLARWKPDIAVLDINLGSENSIEVAEKLLELDVPFVFATGYGQSVRLPESLGSVPIATKPYDSTSLVALIHDAVQRRNRRGPPI